MLKAPISSQQERRELLAQLLLIEFQTRRLKLYFTHQEMLIVVFLGYSYHLALTYIMQTSEDKGCAKNSKITVVSLSPLFHTAF